MANVKFTKIDGSLLDVPVNLIAGMLEHGKHTVINYVNGGSDVVNEKFVDVYDAVCDADEE